MTPEAKVKVIVKALLAAHGAYFCMPPANGYGRAGIPDILACYKGVFIAIECKAGKGKTTALQDKELAAITDAGGVSLVVNETNTHSVTNAMLLIEARSACS